MIEELLQAYRELRCYLTARLRNTEDAADIAQSSFERVYARAIPLTGMAMHIESPRALLFRTASNLCIDIARHQRIADAWVTERCAIDTEASMLSAQDQAEHRQMIAKVAALLEQLPQRRREVFLLFKVYGYSRQEIAAQLNITEAAVAKHVIRATISCVKGFTELQQFPEHSAKSNRAHAVGAYAHASLQP